MSGHNAKKQREEIGYRKYDIHEAIVFCVELSDSMFESVPELNQSSYILEILETLKELMFQLIVVRPNTGIGCYFHYSNNEESKDSNNIFEFLPLRDLNAKNMKKLADLIDDIRRGRISFQDYFKYEHDHFVPLDILFDHLKDKLSQAIEGQRSYTFERIFLFTDNDSPPESKDLESRKRIRRIVDDLNENWINFTTFFIGSTSRPFDNSFYADILQLGSKMKMSEFDGPNISPITGNDIKKKVLRGKEVKRTLFKCPLILRESPNLTIGVRAYSLISHEKSATRYKLFYENEDIREEAFSRRKFLNAKTGEEIKYDKTTKVQQIGDMNIEFSGNSSEEEETVESASYLKIIGFRSRETCVNYFNNIEKTEFIVPDESQYKGSIRTMASLFRTLREKEKVAIIWGKPKSNSNPSLYILIPSTKENYNEGFYLVKIPFSEEIRKFPILLSYGVTSNIPEYENMLLISETIMAYFNLKQGYVPSEFKNPGLQRYYRILRSYLLQEEEDVEEDTSDVSLNIAKLLDEDDTLRKLSYIRDRIEKSRQSDDKIENRLARYFQLWNQYYSKIELEEVGLSKSHVRKKEKKTTLSL